MRVGFIGTGVMGTGIILNLLRENHEVIVYNRTKAHAQTVLDAGAKWGESPKAVAAQSDLTLTMVGFPQDVEAVYLGSDGILTGAKAGQLIVDMTTSTPSLAAKIAKQANKKAVIAFDAPVSGGDIGARNGTLTVMVGGDQTHYEFLAQFLKPIARSIHYFGRAGSGQHAKMANQIMIAGTMTGLSEMLVYSQAAHLDLQAVLTTLDAGGAANWSLENYGPRILKNDYTAGFFAKHFLKDLRIALDEADKMQLDLPATQLAKQLYEQMVNMGKGNDGTQGLITTYPSWKN